MKYLLCEGDYVRLVSRSTFYRYRRLFPWSYEDENMHINYRLLYI